MPNFIPIPGAPYKYDYLDIFKSIANSAGRVKEIPTYRDLCKNDLFFLLFFGLGREDVNAEPKGIDKSFLIQAIREVEEDHEDTMDLWAREHYKSSIITYGLPIQELIKDPEERIAIFSHTRPISKGFLRQIKLTLEDAIPIKKWFPDVFYTKPKSMAPKWSEDDGLYVKRKTHPKEASIEAWGIVDGQPTSKHFSIRIYDDLVTQESVTTPEMIKKVADAYELSQSLGTDGGTKRLVGTHYHFSDLYTVLKKKSGYKVRIKPATDDGTPTGQPVFLSQKRLDELLIEQGPYIFSCQQLLNPIAAGDQKFEPAWLKYYDVLPDTLNVYILCDPANAQKKKSDYTTIKALGVDQYDNRFLLKMVRDKLDLDQRWKALRDMYLSLHKDGYSVNAVGYEKYGKDSDIFYFNKMQEKEAVYFSITELGGRTAKWDRIQRLVPSFKNGKIFLPRRYYYTPVYCNDPGMMGKPVDLVKVFIDEEYTVAPFCVHDDMLDCISRIEDEKLGVTAPMVSESYMVPGGGPMPGASAGASGWMVG
jgi:hypothetical protein